MFLLEVKCFSNRKVELEDFYSALGQYAFYRNAIKATDAAIPIYLAVPNHIFIGLFQNQIVEMTLQEFRVKTVVMDLETQVVRLWKIY